MQDTFIATRTYPDEQDKPHTVHYWLLTQHIPIGRFTLEDYGVTVEDEGGERVCLPSITHSRSRIDALLALLLEHTVTPLNLPDVVEDWAKENRLPQDCGRR